MVKKAICIYTRSDCEDSQSLKRYLSLDQIPYHEIDISQSQALVNELQSITGSSITPAVIVDRKNLFGKPKRTIFNGYTTNRKRIERMVQS